jgi:hypothetical protein
MLINMIKFNLMHLPFTRKDSQMVELPTFILHAHYINYVKLRKLT